MSKRNISKNEEFVMKPKIDFCFKKLMEDEEVRRGFLAAVLCVPKDSIKDTELLPTVLRKDYEEDKQGILDVRVQLEDGTQVDIEIQIAPFTFWIERSLFYLCKMYIDQIQKGEDYDKLQRCIHIGILDFTLFGKCEEYVSCFHLWEDKRRERYSDKFELRVLELPKLEKYEYPQTELLNWAKFINAEKKEEMEKMAQTDDSLKKAYERVVELSADEQERLEYEAREKALRDYNSQMKSNWRAGRREGIKAMVRTCKKLGTTKEEALKMLAEEMPMEEEEARGYVQEFWKENP